MEEDKHHGAGNVSFFVENTFQTHDVFWSRHNQNTAEERPNLNNHMLKSHEQKHRNIRANATSLHTQKRLHTIRGDHPKFI